MSQLERTIVRICHALLREFDGSNNEHAQSTAAEVPDGLTAEASKEVQAVANKIDKALDAAKPDVPPTGDVKDERLGVEVTNMDKGVKGIVVETKQRGWVVIEPTHTIVDGEWEKVSKAKPMSVRWNKCIARAEVEISDEGHILDVYTPKADPIPVDEEKETGNTDAGSYRMTTGIHAGKSIHEIYVDLVDGEVFLKYLAKKTSGLYGDEAKNAAKDFLLSQGVAL